MSRKIILMVGSIIFSALLLVVSYFGIMRYINLYLSTSENFVSNYSKLPEADEKCRVVISLTTTPDKIDKIRPMIRSILDQTVKVDQISLNIPYVSKGEKFDIPDEYADCMNVFRCGKDYGAGCKYIPTLLREGEKDTKIICLSDNYVYGKDFIESLVDASNKNPDTAIYSSGAVLIKPAFFDMTVIELSRVGKCNMEDTLTVEKMDIASSETFRMI